ncbi:MULTISPECIES: NAD-dependent epimerase/dehydratase family protein [Nocardia]|uniref:NAD-dependent epimerase/dehydratase family protein n=1 Tax=Nocardia TaxID=1817 RepID=UPI0007A3BB1E|nr:MULTISPECIES: NAD(P)-dependent oxidoreductase [Nocardia]
MAPSIRTAENSNGSRTGPVLVTGAFGLVGTATVRRLLDTGREVVATDLDNPRNRRVARGIADTRLRVHWADLTDPEQVDELITTIAPTDVVHLAAIIPPLCYRYPDLAEAVNVGATAALVRAAEKSPAPPRFVQASSIAVYGPRNPHRTDAVLAPDTPIRPIDVYGTQKGETERLLITSSLEWIVLRLGGVLSVSGGLAINTDMLRFEAALPADGRIQTVDVRDVAAAFESALTTPATREVFLIAGDSSHRQRQHDVVSSVTAALGLRDVFPDGIVGDPDNDEHWFTTDWVDTERSQQVLAFQQHSWPGMLEEIRVKAGRYRPLLRAAAPLARAWLRRTSPYLGKHRTFADPWNAVTTMFGNPYPESA